MMRWVVQQNLGKRDDTDRMMAAIRALGMSAVGVDVVPFSDDLPDIPNDQPTVFYGATGFINSVYLRGSWRPGTFYDGDAFKFSRYLEEYGDRMLNSGARLTTLGGFKDIGLSPDELVFIRPDRDLKEFAGDVIRVGDFTTWVDDLSYGNYTLRPECPIVVADPVGIRYEWRTFIVNGQVVTGSQYRRDGTLCVEASLPTRVRKFAEACAGVWSPAPVFVMDIGQSGAELYIIELGCVNSAGFYASDIELLIKEISHHIKDTVR